MNIIQAFVLRCNAVYPRLTRSNWINAMAEYPQRGTATVPAGLGGGSVQLMFAVAGVLTCPNAVLN